jgi:lysine/ornithine N-monooxygenase
MKTSSITIIGAGPRGLSLALYALYTGLKVTVIDPKPLSSWSKKNMISDLEMRSPISFDLVSYLPELQSYSLATYLGQPWDYCTQVAVETNPTKVLRSEFFDYISHIWDTILPQITFIQKQVVSISNNKVFVNKRKKPIVSDFIALAIGSASKPKLPFWLENTNYKNKIVTTQSVLSKRYEDKSFLVIGSGQGSAEYTAYLAKDNKVTWLVKKEPKVNQFPSPSYAEWKTKSALGNYFAYLPLSKQPEYFQRVKEWQPSITPTVKSALDSLDYETLFLNNLDSTQLMQVLEEVDLILIQTGLNPSIETIPFEQIIERDIQFSQFPKLENFQLSNLPIFVTGGLATAFDGPRQQSLVSAGLTSKTIINTILNSGSVNYGRHF